MRGRVHAGLVVVLLAGLLVPLTPVSSSAAPPPSRPGCPAAGRPDRVSAGVAARMCGGRVEVTSDLSETTRVWAEPNGTFTGERTLGVTRFQRTGRWVEVDLNLVRNADGSVAPRAHPNGLTLSGAAGAGQHDLAVVRAGGEPIAMAWDGALPAPVLAGTRATYPEVRPGIDLVVEATRSGFEQLLVVKTPAAVPLVNSVKLSLRSAGPAPEPDGAGGLVFKNQAGAVLARTPAPLMWDAATASQAKQVGIGLGATRAGGVRDLTLSPDEAWLSDRARQFPIMIDPYVVPVATGFDTYVQSNVSSATWGSTELRIGSQNSGSVVAQSFVNLNATGLNGSRINWATLKLWESYAPSCTAAGWEVWRTNTNASQSTRWSNRPAMVEHMGTSIDTRGSSGCAPGWVEIEARNLYQYAADRNWGEFTAGLKAYWEDTNSFYKVFRSKESATLPHVSLNWNEPPVLSGLTTNPTTSGCVIGASRPWMTSRTPRLSATVSDSDGAASDLTFEVANTGNPTPIAGYQDNGVASGTAGKADLAAGVLQEGRTYSWHVLAKDQAGTPVSPWSSWCEFTVDSRAPGVPWVSSTEFPENGRATVGSGTFTIRQASTAADGAPENGVLASYSYQLDGAPAPTTVTADAAGTASVSLTNLTDGNRSLTVIGKDKAGNASAPKVYSFAVGRAGIAEPLPGATVPKSTKIALEIPDPALTRVTVKYRRGPGAPEYPIPLANLRKADLSPVPANPVPWAQTGGFVVWDATDTLGSLGGIVEIGADVFPNADGQPAYATAWVKVTVDPNGDGAASTSAGPGQLNLLTGDHTLSATDIDEFGLSVSRAASSREPADGWIPQGERLSGAQQQVSDLTGFTTVACAQPGLQRSTTRGQGGSTDSLGITVQNCGSDSFAVVGGNEAFRQDMKPGRKYKLSAWIYVPGSVGLDPGWYGWGQSAMGITTGPTTGTQRFYSGGARYTDAWQELSVVMDVPANATDARFVLWNAGRVGATVYFDHISVTELLAPFGPRWRGGVTDPISGSDYRSITVPDKDSVVVNLLAGGQIWFGKSATGQFHPAPGAESLSLKQAGANFELSELDGTVTEFVKQSDTTFITSRSWDAAITPGTGTRFDYDRTDYRTLVTKVISATEPGVETAGGRCTDAVPAKGCEVLEYDYAPSTTARPGELGDVRDQVRSVRIWSWDPAANAVTSVEVARYRYDENGQLRQVYDPRTDSAGGRLSTVYEYDTGGRVSKVTPAGQLPWMFDYGTIDGDPNAGRLHRVRRASLVQGSRTQTGQENATRIVYRVPTTRAGGGPYDLSAAAVAGWGQSDTPTSATAIFGPEDDPGTVLASPAVPGQNGYGFATVHYLNANGQRINTATPVAKPVADTGGANLDSVQYDRFGNEVWSLEATNRLIALGQYPQSDLLGKLGLATAAPADRAHQLATLSTYSADGKDLVSKTGPRMTAILDGAHGDRPAGAPVVGRPRTEYTYDENKPDGASYHLVTTEKTGLRVGDIPGLADERRTTNGYAPVNGSHSGWILRKATEVTSDAGGANLKAYSVYDSSGRVLKSWGIGSSGTDAATKQTIYYTSGANGSDATCGGKPEWAGQPCVTASAGAVTGHDPARMPGTLPVRRVRSYNRYGDAAVVSESNAGKTRTTTTTFDAAGRVSTVDITTDDGSTPVPVTSTGYDPATGQPVSTTAGTASSSREFDLLSRTVRYTDADGGSTVSEYDRYGRPARTVDPTGTVTYGYDRAAEPRGMLTELTDSTAGTFAAGYSPDGQLTTLRYPGGITRTDTLDTNLQPLARKYSRDSDGFVLFTETIEENAHGQWATHTYRGGSKTFGYDRLGRLTRASHMDFAHQCTVRRYTFDGTAGARTNRTGKQTWQPGAGGGCVETGPADQITGYAYDSADRLVSTGYRYDEFGRTTALPSGLVNTFHANDMVASQTLGDSRQNWTLDPAMRLRAFTTETRTGGVWGNPVTKVNHYAGDGDSPKWIVESAANGTWTRNVTGPGGDLAATVTLAGAKLLHAVNLHGDVAFTLDLADPLGAPEAYYDYEEFGNPIAGTPGRYGWLGGKQRSSEALDGVTLMGARLYSSATGRFLSVDPVDGGSANAYDYCHADPVNCTDLDGKWSWKKIVSTVAVVASVAAIIPGPIGTAAALISAGAYAATGDYKSAAIMAGTAALAMVGAGAVGVAAAGAVRAGSRAATFMPKIAQGARAAGSFFRATRLGPITTPSRFSQAVGMAQWKLAGAAIAIGRGAKAVGRGAQAVGRGIQTGWRKVSVWSERSGAGPRIRAGLACGNTFSNAASNANGRPWMEKAAYGFGFAIGVWRRYCPDFGS